MKRSREPRRLDGSLPASEEPARDVAASAPQAPTADPSTADPGTADPRASEPTPAETVPDATAAGEPPAPEAAVPGVAVERDAARGPAAVAPPPRRHRAWWAFLASFLVALVAGAALVVGAVTGYVESYEGRVLPGVHVGTVDLSGLDRATAGAALEAAYRGLGEGRVVIDADGATVEIAEAAIDRRLDTQAMLDQALAVGAGTGLPRALALVGITRQGVTIEPRMTYDPEALDRAIAAGLGRLEIDPIDATISMGPRRIVTTPASVGRTFDVAAVQAAAREVIGQLDAPQVIRLTAPSVAVEPVRGDAVVAAARAQAARMIADLVVTNGTKEWTIKSGTVRRWLTFEPGVEEAVRPVVVRARIAPALAKVATKVRTKAVSATFLRSKSGKIVGVRTGHNGKRLDVAGTTGAIAAELGARAQGARPKPVTVAIASIAPKLSNAEATKVAPRMALLGSWTTRFEISERNYWGANIWLPARFINGTLLSPGQRFEWFSAIGPVTPARGFGSGGIIKGNHSEPTGAMGGGMCSSSTTLFNAALRAGLRMGARANHTYYIDRYPLGLDATVWASGGAVQTMSFTNDMRTPVLVLGLRSSSGGFGYVTYEIWGVPDGRTVRLSAPVVRNVLPATTVERETSTLPPGVREQTEWQANGMDVWVSRLVTSGSGRVMSRDTWYSHYTRWTGIILVGAR